jgi:hypothetical protein
MPGKNCLFLKSNHIRVGLFPYNRAPFDERILATVLTRIAIHRNVSSFGYDYRMLAAI